TVAYAEAPALSSCIFHILDSTLRVQRLLVRTDSASSAYTFNAGGAGGSQHPAIMKLVCVVYKKL
ncbi:hypothetical protein JCM1840_002977, partial [Sporobolomyces johnsonii]